MEVTYFRSRKDGPELAIENAVANCSRSLFTKGSGSSWIGGSMPIGAGMPDLLVVSYKSEISSFENPNVLDDNILGYLRTVNFVGIETISERIGESRETVSYKLKYLEKYKIVLRSKRNYRLLPIWRNILPQVIAIEAKVKNWQVAIKQAARNRLFAHRSFIALPCDTSKRIRSEPILGQLGIGLLSVDQSGDVSILKQGRSSTPKIWTYYYKIASFIAGIR